MPSETFYSEFKKMLSHFDRDWARFVSPCTHYARIISEFAIRDLKVHPDWIEFRRTSLDGGLRLFGFRSINWEYHAAVAIGDEVWDPFLGEPVPVDQYAKKVFPNNEPEDYTISRSPYRVGSEELRKGFVRGGHGIR